MALTPEEVHELRGEAAALIREHLWLGKAPPRSVDSRPWTMARELSIWNLLVKANFRPCDINGAISVVRNLRKDWESTPVRMTVFYWRRPEGFCSTPFLEMCIGYHLKHLDRERTHKLDVPPKINEVLRRAIG